MACTETPYAIGGVNLATFSFRPRAPYALSGAYDLPARIGQTKQDWADENFVEPFIREDEFFLGGRDLVLRGYIKGDTAQLSTAYHALNSHLDSLMGAPTTLSCGMGYFQVFVVDFKTVRKCPTDMTEIEITMRQPEVVPWGYAPSNPSGGAGINGYSWADLGFMLNDVHAWDRGAYKTLEVSAYGKEKIRSVARGSSQFKLVLAGRAASLSEIALSTGKLAHLVGTHGRKMLYLNDGLNREFFLESGFKTEILTAAAGTIYYRVQMTLTEIRTSREITVLGGSDFIIGNKHGEAIAFISH